MCIQETVVQFPVKLSPLSTAGGPMGTEMGITPDPAGNDPVVEKRNLIFPLCARGTPVICPHPLLHTSPLPPQLLFSFTRSV